MFGSYVYFLFSSVLRPIFFNKKEDKMEEKSAKQIINFSGSDPDPTFAVSSRDVEIISAKGTNTNGISRIKASNIVDYSWEERFYSGQMLAVHRSGKYIAYGIKGKAKAQCSIRIVNRVSGIRALMKEGGGMIEDLSFAQTPNIILLAFVDNTGALFVYHITENSSEISDTLILHVIPSDPVKEVFPYRVFWALSIPEEEYDEDDVSKLLAITRNNKIELWSIATVCPNFEPTEGPIIPGEVKDGYLEIEAHDDLITEAVFSPDGTAIATASLDGTCKFYQVYMPGEAESRCLHQWSPHHGRPVTMLLFLDDLTKFNPDVPFWKYAVTATADNSELALWSCETWQRLQLIKFKNTGSSERKFKIGTDISASIMVINDMLNKIFYILELHKGDILTNIPYVSTVTELRLNYAILSFGIVEASVGPLNPNMSPALNQPTSRINGENEEELGVMIRMYIVQPKSLQSCDIVYPTKRSKIPMPSPLPSDYENGDCSFDNGVSNSEEDTKPDIPSDNGDGDQPTPEEEELSCIPLPPQPSLNLMTPDAFSSSTVGPDAVLVSVDSEIDLETDVIDSETDTAPKPTDQSSANSQPQPKSGGSSPSREVEEILALKNINFFNQDCPVSVAPPILPPVPPPASVLSPQQATQTLPNVNQLPNRDVRSEDKSCGPSDSSVQDHELKDDLKTLCQILQQQNQEIQDLKRHMEIMDGRLNNMDKFSNIVESHNNQIINKISSHYEKLEKQINSQQEKAMLLHTGMLENMNNLQKNSEKLHSNIIEKMNSHQEETVSHICQLVDNSITTRLVPMIHSQLVNMITPAIRDLKSLIHEELTIKLTATDVLLKENIAKMMKSKALVDSMASGVAAVGKEGVTQLCKEALNQALPKIEKVCSTMMSDMAETFSNGTSQYVSEVESQLKRLTEHWHMEVNNLHASFLEQSNAQISQMINKSINEMEDRLLRKLTKTIMKAINSGPASRVMTPAVGSSSQAEITRLIEQCQYADAFQAALSAAELPLVQYVCEKIPVDKIFSEKGSILQQPAILSLIQQLSADTSNYSKAKHMYLSEAVMNLDAKTPVTQQHMPGILATLNKQLNHFMVNNPTSPLIRNVKMLQMATQSLLKQ